MKQTEPEDGKWKSDAQFAAGKTACNVDQQVSDHDNGCLFGGAAHTQDYIRAAACYGASAITLQCAPSESKNWANAPPKSCFLGGMLFAVGGLL